MLAARYSTLVDSLTGKVAPVEQGHRHLQHLLYRFLRYSRTETPQGSLPACASGDVANTTGATRIAESGKRDYSRSLLSELDVKVSLHPAQASQRPCEGPVSSDTTCWLHDTAEKSMPSRGR